MIIEKNDIEEKMSRFFIGFVSNPNFHFIAKPHSHPFYEIILTLKGTRTVTVGARTELMHEGNVLIIPPDVLHSGCSEGNYEEIYIQFDSFPFFAEELNNGIFYIHNEMDSLLTKVAQDLLYRFVGGKKDTTLSLQYELFLRLLTEKCGSPKTDPVVEEVCSLLTRNYHDPELSVAKVLAATGYQKDHIRRRFVAAFGCTPIEYLTSLRIENAKKLLERRYEMELTVSEIAIRCGYYDSHYFSKAFKKRVGISPEHYTAKREEEI